MKKLISIMLVSVLIWLPVRFMQMNYLTEVWKMR